LTWQPTKVVSVIIPKLGFHLTYPNFRRICDILEIIKNLGDQLSFLEC
jgi:hypothetical protein